MANLLLLWSLSRDDICCAGALAEQRHRQPHSVAAEPHEAAQRAERAQVAADLSEADIVETGAQELRQLYPDASTDMCRLLCQNRLVVVLDLDHTLVNSARQTEIEPEHLLVPIKSIFFALKCQEQSLLYY